jgi:hypothetical protein
MQSKAGRKVLANAKEPKTKRQGQAPEGVHKLVGL